MHFRVCGCLYLPWLELLGVFGERPLQPDMYGTSFDICHPFCFPEKNSHLSTAQVISLPTRELILYVFPIRSPSSPFPFPSPPALRRLQNKHIRAATLRVKSWFPLPQQTMRLRRADNRPRGKLSRLGKLGQIRSRLQTKLHTCFYTTTAKSKQSGRRCVNRCARASPECPTERTWARRRPSSAALLTYPKEGGEGGRLCVYPLCQKKKTVKGDDCGWKVHLGLSGLIGRSRQSVSFSPVMVSVPWSDRTKTRQAESTGTFAPTLPDNLLLCGSMKSKGVNS